MTDIGANIDRRIDVTYIFDLLASAAPLSIPVADKATVLHLVYFIVTAARAENGRLVLRPTNGTAADAERRMTIWAAMERVARGIGHPFNHAIGQATLMMIHSIFDTLGDVNAARASIDPHERDEFFARQRIIARVTGPNTATSNNISGIPEFVNASASAEIYVIMIRAEFIPIVLGQIVTEYLWSPTSRTTINYCVRRMHDASPYARWFAVAFGASGRPLPEEVVERLREEKPDAMIMWEAEIERHLTNYYPRRPMRGLLSECVAAWPAKVVKNWGFKA